MASRGMSGCWLERRLLMLLLALAFEALLPELEEELLFDMVRLLLVSIVCMVLCDLVLV